MLLLDKATVIKLLSEKSILKSDIFMLQSSSMKHENNLNYFFCRYDSSLVPPTDL